MSDYDPLTTTESLRTVSNYEPTPAAMEATRATGFGSMPYRYEDTEPYMRSGQIYIGSTGRHRAQLEPVVKGLYGIYAWAFLVMGLNALFVTVLAASAGVPGRITLGLGVAPGVCLVILSAYTALAVRRRRCDCGGWRVEQ